jgi:hypothetical protein
VEETAEVHWLRERVVVEWGELQTKAMVVVVATEEVEAVVVVEVVEVEKQKLEVLNEAVCCSTCAVP